MIKQTQDQWFGSNYFASDSDRDLVFPDFRKLASAFDFDYTLIESLADLENLLPLLTVNSGVKFCEIKIQHDARVIPIVKFGNPNHLMEPEN
jgi:thiamine pyrophosphate-dependent acetolactate synthase large subunit-like protein